MLGTRVDALWNCNESYYLINRIWLASNLHTTPERALAPGQVQTNTRVKST